MTVDDVISHNPQFRVLCWEVKTPKGDIISVSTRKHAETVALREWPSLSDSSPDRGNSK
jgi:hypothetical protein